MNLGWTDGNWTLHFDEMKLGDAGAAYFMHSLRRYCLLVSQWVCNSKCHQESMDYLLGHS